MACRIERLDIDFVALGVDGDQHRFARRRGAGFLRENVKRGNADGRLAERKRQTARGRDPDTDTGKRSRADGDGDAIDIANRTIGAGERLVDELHQPFGMATADIGPGLSENGVRATVIDGSGTAGPGGVDGKDDHFSCSSSKRILPRRPMASRSRLLDKQTGHGPEGRSRSPSRYQTASTASTSGTK